MADEAPKTIKFRLNPAANLRRSLESLRDNELNPLHMAMVGVNHKGFRIVVQSKKNGVLAFLVFLSAELIDFRCTQPLWPHYMFLDQIVDFLKNVPDNETITIFHIASADQPQLFFKFKPEGAPARKLKLGLMKVFPQQIPSAKVDCTARIPSDVLNWMIQHLKEEPQKLVSVALSDKLLTISIGLSNIWHTWRITGDIVKPERRMKYHARFKLPHLEAIRKASLLYPNPCICVLSQPENHITMIFWFSRHATLWFLVKAEMLDATPDVDSLVGDASDASQPGADISEASQPVNDAAEASQPVNDAAEASQPDGDAAEASLLEVKASQPGGDVS